MSAELAEPLLPRRRERCLEPGAVNTSIVLLTAAAIGTGVLALPYGVSCVGVLPAVALFALAALAAYSSNNILFQCVRATDAPSYGELMTHILGPGGAMLLDAFVCVEGLGSVATYLVFITDYVPQVCALAGEDAWCTDRHNVVIATCLIVWPLSCLKGLSALRYVSTCSIATITFTSIVVVLKAPGNFARTGQSIGKVLQDVRLNMDAFQVLSMACFAFMTHTNTPDIARQLRKPGLSVGRKVVAAHTAVLCTLYSLIAVCGYLSFLGKTQQDFLTNYDLRDALVVVSRSLLSVTLVMACPINMNPAIQALFNILETLRGRRDGEPKLYDRHAIRVPAATALFAAALLVALRSPHVADLISGIGAFLTSPLMFAFPALMYWRILRRRGKALPAALLLLTAALWAAEIARMLR